MAGGKRIHFLQEQTLERLVSPKCLTLNRYVYRQYLPDPKCMCLCMCVYMRVGKYMCSCVYVSHVFIMYNYVTITTTKEEDMNLKGVSLTWKKLELRGRVGNDRTQCIHV